MPSIPLRYNLRSLRVRWMTTLLTIGGIGLVVTTFVAVMGLATGLASSMGTGAVPDNVILLYKGGISEAMSRVTIDQYQVLQTLPHVARTTNGTPLVSIESLIQINATRRTGGETLVVMRGMRPVGMDVHRGMRLVAGRRFRPQTGECVVGKGAIERFVGLEMGKTFKVGQRRFTVVGVTTSDGSSHESEIWADLDDVLSAAQRDWCNSVTARLRDPRSLTAFQAAVRADPRLDLGVRSEPDYYGEQAGDAEGFRFVGLIVCFFMAVGACLAEMNTMYAAIGSRTREIGTLRALGFGRGAVLASFLVESVLLAAPGGAAGCLAGMAFDGFSTSVISFATVSEVSFRLVVTSRILGGAFAFSLALGVIGGLLPALQAARLPILDALRKL